MGESIKCFRKRNKHIEVAMEVNKRHDDVLRNKSEEHKARSNIQIMGELSSNKHIEYRRHMKWMREFTAE